jgi:hypothetical protein
MGAYAAIYPGQRLRVPLLGVDVAGVTVILAWLGWEAAQAIATVQHGTEIGVGHWAHVGGLVCGLVMGPAMSGGAPEAEGETPGRPDVELPLPTTNPQITATQTAALAVEQLTRVGEREHALTLYRQALEEGRALRLPGPVEFRLADWLAAERDWAGALDAFLTVSHSEVEPERASCALFRAVQIAEEHLRRPELAERLRQDLRFRFPQSTWSALAAATPRTKPSEE